MDATPTEEWRPVVGYEGRYEVSDQGRVRSVFRGAPYVLKPQRGLRYLHVGLYRDTIERSQSVHLTVARAWLGPCPPGMEVRHLNGQPFDCRVANLAYGTRSQNQHDSVRHGTHHEARKTHCPQNHPYDRVNTKTSSKGKRQCRECARIYMREYRRRAAVQSH